MDGVNFIIFFAFLATIAVLIVGQVSMARGGKFDDDHSVGACKLNCVTAHILIP